MKTTNISSRQIKAARALLDWSQEDLAEASGLSVATIRKIEAGGISPRSSTNDQIIKAVEKAGLEFRPYEGLRRKPEEITIHEGREGICAFFDDVYAYAAKNGGDITTVCINEDPISESLGDYGEVHRSRMCDLMRTTSVKCILTENYKSMPAKYCEYRSISKAYVDSVPFYIYGDHYAVFLFDVNPSPRIIVYKSKALADAFRKQFYSMWEKAAILSEPQSVQESLNNMKRKANVDG